jgi:DGQHR domain-containing protein
MPRRPLTADQIKKRAEKAFSRKVQFTFKNAGFEYLSTKDEQKQFGAQMGDIDSVFLYENILLVCEDTIAITKHKDHLRKKKDYFDEIAAHQNDLLSWLKERHGDKFAKFNEYDLSRYKISFLYLTKNKLNLTSEEIQQFAPLIIVEDSALSYFQKLSQNIRFSAKSDIFRFLKLRSCDVGPTRSTSGRDEISTTIICPSDTTGLPDGVRLVSFMLSAKTLIDNSYVLRKDNWEKSPGLYQRLIEKNRIQSIRKHVATTKTTFFNNIIVSLPQDVSFRDEAGQPIDIEAIQDFNAKHTMQIPNEFNTICVIDGQHRIFAHYEGEDAYERTIAGLRDKFHLLVTGIVFPASMSENSRRKMESEIFLDINSNAKPVPPDVLLYIEMLKDRFSDLGIARQVLERLNEKTIFQNYFQLSLMEGSRIKIASIIKFALRNLVEINNDPDKETLYKHWTGDPERKLLSEENDELLNQYIDYVVGLLDQYFSALKAVYGSQWDDNESKILSTTSINGFIMALRRTLDLIGPKDFDFYREAFNGLTVDFAKASFGFTSSQYNKFSKVILKEAFGIIEQSDGSWAMEPTANEDAE